MRVREVMTRDVRTIEAGASIARAGVRMQAAGVHQLVVRDTRRRVVGVIGRADVRAAADDGAVGDFMSPRLWIVRPGTSLGCAAALMREHAVGSLPVMDGTRLVGIITVSDLLDFVDRNADSLAATAVRRERRPRRVRVRLQRPFVKPIGHS